ncbi:hypothetical protein [Nitratireductor alexandrii]|uniref:hypothetical protein n=1 Tax=Nitratireductor alexandrii TaxID=2448161 RepID=UPI000FDB0E10|nr:hypothetical protein [Nitratireductor alexandrii]
MQRIKVFFDNKRGVRVTERVFSTRMRDHDLACIVFVKIGRDPLMIAGVTGLALALFAFQFGDLLYPGEQMSLLAIGACLLGGGYALASLTVGTIFNEKTVWHHDLWTVKKVRDAIRNAQHVRKHKRRATGERRPTATLRLPER